MYQKIGMFGVDQTNGTLPPDSFQGDQIRGFGFGPDGAHANLFRFISDFDLSPQNPVGIPLTPAGVQVKKDMEDYMLAFESNLAPIVGQQVTLNAMNQSTVSARINLLEARADVDECDLVAKGHVGSFNVGFVYLGNGSFAADRQASPPISATALRSIVTSGSGTLTYTCAPPGSGQRLGVDRDLDGFLDGDELAAGSDPADPDSTP